MRQRIFALLLCFTIGITSSTSAFANEGMAADDYAEDQFEIIGDADDLFTEDQEIIDLTAEEDQWIYKSTDSDIVSSGMCGDAASWSLDSDGTLTISGEGSIYEYGISGEFMPPWTDYIHDITAAVVEPGITDLGASAFQCCDKLVSVSLPEGLTDVGEWTFYYCSSLTNVDLPDSVSRIGECAFEYCYALKSIRIPDSLSEICNFAFNYCTSLENVSLPSALVFLGEYAFGDCSQITEITIPERIEELETCVLSHCSSLEKVSFQGPVKKLGAYAFSKDTSLKEIVLPDTLESIGECCFGWSGLEQIEIPDSVKTIGDSAFAVCSFLQTIRIGKGLEPLTVNPFSECPDLTSITVSAENNNYSFVDGVLFSKNMKVLYIYLPTKTDTEYNIPDSVTEIRDEAFYGCTNLQKVTMSDSVESLGRGTFVVCSNLKEIRLSEQLKSLWATFDNCISLESITLPSQLESIGHSTFHTCTLLKAITLPESMKEIGERAFFRCDSLEEITVLSNECEAKMENSTIPSETIIKCNKGALIENYAQTYGRRIVYLDDGSGGDVLTGNSAYVNLLPVEGVTPSAYTNSMVSNVQNGVLVGYEPKIAIPNDLNDETYLEILSKTRELTADCATDYEKAVEIIRFVGQYLEYRYAVPCDSNIESVYETWNKKYGNCMGYTALTNFMLYLCGIPNATVNTSDHQYSMALINGKWIPFDATGGRYDFDISKEDNIENIFFSIGKVSYVINDATGVKLAGYGTSVAARDEEEIGVIDIPDYVTFIFGNVFSANTSPVTVAGNIESYAYEFAKNTFRFTLEENGRFTAFNYVGSEDLVKTEAKAATCTEIGNIEYWFCPALGKYFSDQTLNVEIEENSWVIPAKGHTSGEAVVENEITATCTKEGCYDEVVYCSVCHEELSRTKITIEKLAHTPIAIPAVEATCTETGLTEGSKCSVCGEILKIQETVPALGHDYKSVVTAPTCEEEGFTTYTCSRCNDSYVADYVDALSHDYVGIVTKEPTCTEKGIKTYTCKNDSSHQYTEDIPAKGHSWGEWTVVKEATETETGLESRTCLNDPSHVETREIPVLQHQHVMSRTAPVAATCEKSGNIEYWTCSGCRRIFSDELGENEINTEDTVIPALGHDYVGAVTKEATCAEEGIRTYTCTHDSTHTYTEAIAKLAHTSEAAVRENEVPATCSKAGSYDEVVYCSVCHEELGRKTITTDILRHRTETIPAIEATCTETGLTEGTKCSDCGKILTPQETIPAKGHSYQTTVKKATITENGKSVTKCSDCSDIQSSTVIYRPKTFKLSATSYVYNGKARKPTVTVTDAKGKTIASSNYSVTYASGRKNVGTYTVTVKMKGNYSGTKELTFKIVPKTTTLKSVTASSKQFTVKWTKQATQTSGYQIQYSLKKGFTSGNKTVYVTSNKTVSKVIKSLTSGKTYYVRIRTYKTVNGTKYFSAWSNAFAVKVK